MFLLNLATRRIEIAAEVWLSRAQSAGNGPLWWRIPTTWRVHKGQLSEPVVADGPVAVIALVSRKGDDAARRSALAGGASEVGTADCIRHGYPTWRTRGNP